MRFKKASAVALAIGLALTGVGIAEEIMGSDEMSMRVWKVGEELKCLCGCAYTVASCNMINCHFREEVNPQIQEGLEEGLDPTRIVEMLRAKLRDAERQLAAVGSAEDNMRVQKDLRDARAAITTLEDRITELQHVCTVLSLY